MRHLFLAGAIVLGATTTSAAQQLAPRNAEPIKIVLVNVTFEEAIGFVSKQVGIEVQFDDSATRERLNAKLTLKLEGVTLEEALDTITRVSGLTYKVVDAQTILIYQLP